jgi:hypothetical protein
LDFNKPPRGIAKEMGNANQKKRDTNIPEL